MPGEVLARTGSSRQTRAGGSPSYAPARPGSAEGTPNAGAAPRRSQRGRQLRRSSRCRDGAAGFSLPIDDRLRTVARGPVLPARSVRDRSGESVATQGDPGPDPRRRDRGRDRRRGGCPDRPGAPLRGPGARRARSTGPRKRSGPRSAARATRGPGPGSATSSPSGWPSAARARTMPSGTPGSGPTATGRCSCVHRRAAGRRWPSGSSIRGAGTSTPTMTTPPGSACPGRSCPRPGRRRRTVTATVTPIASRLSSHAAEPRAESERLSARAAHGASSGAAAAQAPAPQGGRKAAPSQAPAPPGGRKDDPAVDRAQPAAPASPAQARPVRKAAGGRTRRSSVPSWDEIMLGNSRQPD